MNIHQTSNNYILPGIVLVSVIKYNHHSIEISQVYYRTIPGMGYDSNH